MKTADGPVGKIKTHIPRLVYCFSAFSDVNTLLAYYFFNLLALVLDPRCYSA